MPSHLCGAGWWESRFGRDTADLCKLSASGRQALGQPDVSHRVSNVYATTDLNRPAKELLVHSLEHGYTVIWYDETLAANGAAVADLKGIAAKYPR